jgi:hypothetical protein
MRRHPRYRALPPVEDVVLSGGGGVDDAMMPFLRQHTPAWEAARVGRVTTGNLATALGLWCSEAAIGQLNLPKAGFKSREMQGEELEQAAAARGGGGGRAGGQQQRQRAPDDDDESSSSSNDDDDDDDEMRRRTTSKDGCVRTVDAYNASFGPRTPADYTSEAEGGWAVSTHEAVEAAASGARKVAAALGREQENAALYALLQACPNSTLLETGLIPLDVRSAQLKAWGFRAGDLPAMVGRCTLNSVDP